MAVYVDLVNPLNLYLNFDLIQKNFEVIETDEFTNNNP